MPANPISRPDKYQPDASMLQAGGRFLLRNAVWVVLAIVTIAFVIVEPRMFSVRIFINVLEHSSILGILVIGMVFCLLTGRFDLSSESTLGFSALVGGWMVSTNVNFGSEWFLPPPVVVIVMLVIGMAIGCFNSFFILKLNVNAFIVTLATLLSLRGFTYVFTNANTMYDFPDSFIFLGGYSIGGTLPLSVILFISLFVLGQFVLTYTRFGRDLYAIGGNPEAAFAAGIRVGQRTLAAFIISGMLGALAGWVLAGRLQAVTINLGQGMVFEVFAAAVIGGVSLAGGKGNMIGPLGGVLLLGVITTGLSVMPISSFWVDAVRGILILLAVVLWRLTEIYEERWRSSTR